MRYLYLTLTLTLLPYVITFLYVYLFALLHLPYYRLTLLPYYLYLTLVNAASLPSGLPGPSSQGIHQRGVQSEGGGAVDGG